MALETIRKFTATGAISGKAKLPIRWDVAFTVKRDTSNGAYWITFDDVIAYSTNQDRITRVILNEDYGDNYYSFIQIDRKSGTQGTIYKQRLGFSSTVETYVKDGTTYYARRAAAPSGMYFVPSEVSANYQYYVRFYASIHILDSGQATTGSLQTTTGSLFYLPRVIDLTAPNQVRLNDLNSFSLNFTPPTYYTSSYLAIATQYGAFGVNYGKSSDLYVGSTTKFTSLASAVSNLYWYPNVADAEPGDFVNNIGQYKLFAETKAYSISDFGSYPWVTFVITGQIVYNETPPAAAVSAMSVYANVTESGAYTGILARYGKYIDSLSKLNLSAGGSSSFGYGTTVSNTVRLNGVISTSSKTGYSPPEGEGSWSVVCTDNHGVQKSLERTWDTYHYETPQLTDTSIHRCRQDGTHDDNGAYAHIEWGTKVSPLGNQNSKALTIVQPEGTSQITPATYEAIGSIIVEADTDQSYNIVYTLVDDFRSVSKTVRLSTAYVLIDVYHTGRGIAFGKVSERDEKLEISADLLTIMHTPGGQMIDVRASLIAGQVVYYTDPET